MGRRFLIVQATLLGGAIAVCLWQQNLAGLFMACAALVAVAYTWHKNQ